MKINSYEDAKKYTFRVERYEAGDGYLTKYYRLVDIESGEPYLKGNIHWLERMIEEQGLVISNKKELAEFVQNDLPGFRIVKKKKN